MDGMWDTFYCMHLASLLTKTLYIIAPLQY